MQVDLKALTIIRKKLKAWGISAKALEARPLDPNGHDMLDFKKTIDWFIGKLYNILFDMASFDN